MLKSAREKREDNSYVPLTPYVVAKNGYVIVNIKRGL